MKKFNLYILISFLLITLSAASAQTDNGKITGKVVDLVTKEPLIGANILVVGTNLGSATNIDGKFTIQNLSPGFYRIKVSIVGYESKTLTDINVSPGKLTQVQIELTPAVLELESITVRADYFQKNPLGNNSIRYFNYEEIRRSPGGFEDVIRALSVLPGVAQADAGRNDLVVRGGAPSENLYLVDGIEIPNINHFGTQGATGGPLSYINLDFVNETSFSTGGFSALYGDKLSSVLKINLREGRDDRLGGKATISATQFGLNIEGPISEKSSFILSARRSYLDFIFKAAGFSFVPEYYDVLGKANFQIDNKNSISFLFLSAFDNVRFFNTSDEQKFDNSRILGSDQIQYATSISYRKLFNKGFLNFSVSRNFTDYNTRQNDSLLNPVFRNISLEKENNLKADIVYQFSKTSEINFGLSAKFINFDADILFPTFTTSFGDTLPISSLIKSQDFQKYAAFANYTFNPISRLTINAGIRLDYFNGINEKFSFSPRLSMTYKLSELSSINFSTGVYYQSPSYIWLTAIEENKNLTNIKVNQFVLGIDHLIDEATLLKVEGFYKEYKNYPTSFIRPYLVLANTGAGFSGSDDNFSSFGLEPLVNDGVGDASGIEFSIQKKLSDSPYYGILSLTYSETNFTPLDGFERPGNYDQNWIFNLSGGYKIDNHWEVSSKFRFASGRPYTPFNAGGLQMADQYNSRRLKSAHSLDLRVDRRWYLSGWTLITYIDIQNVYNNSLANGVRWDQREMRVDESSSIGLLPSIGISAEF